MASGGMRGDVPPEVSGAFDEMRAAVEKPRRIALLGSAPSSIKHAPLDHPAWEIWGCSPGCAQHLKPEQADAWFEIHAWDTNRADLDAAYIAFMRAIQGPVYTIAPVPDLPNSVAYLLLAVRGIEGNLASKRRNVRLRIVLCCPQIRPLRGPDDCVERE